MMFKSLFSFAAASLALLGAAAQVTSGPFALYLESEDPNWNNRYIHIAARDGHISVVDSFATPADIPTAAHNFYITQTNVVDPYSNFGRLVWGAQPPYGELSFQIDIAFPESNVQPFLGVLNPASQGYSTRWGFLPDSTLTVGGLTNFQGLHLNLPRYNADAVCWKFGTGDPSNTFAVPVQLKRFPAL